MNNVRRVAIAAAVVLLAAAAVTAGEAQGSDAAGSVGLRATRAALEDRARRVEGESRSAALGKDARESAAREAAAIRRTFPDHAVPVSSTKSVAGQALEAAGLLEFIVTALALRRGELPVNAGFLGPDGDCPLDVITEQPRKTDARYAVSVNAAFGGANTALVVGAP